MLYDSNRVARVRRHFTLFETLDTHINNTDKEIQSMSDHNHNANVIPAIRSYNPEPRRLLTKILPCFTSVGQIGKSLDHTGKQTFEFNLLLPPNFYFLPRLL
jgi:hypothetical protein